MKKFAILGHPVAHSLSPKLHNAVFQALGLKDYHYGALDVLPEQLPEVLQKMRAGEYQGFSVTIPHKQAVMEYCDELSERARRVGAVNTLIKGCKGCKGFKGFKGCKGCERNLIVGDNTDYVGFEKSLIEAGVIQKSAGVGFAASIGKRKPTNVTSNETGNRYEQRNRKTSKALVLGSGGASKAVVAVLKDLGFKVVVASRNPKDTSTVSYAQLDPEDDYGMIVNCTPVGMTENPKSQNPNSTKNENIILKDEKWYRADRVYVDVVYTPRITPFLKKAQGAGAKIVTGDRMFLWQAVEQSSLFTGGEDVPIEVMEEILDKNIE